MIQFGEENSKLNLQFEDEMMHTPGANIKVVGVGGGGGNAVDRMIESGVSGVDFIVANTDAQALGRSNAPVKIQIGSKVTKGLGAGAKPEIGRESALEDTNALLEHLEGADMVFVTAGLGGGTGTGAAPIIASLASELGALVVAVVTSPFSFEGPRRRRNAINGLRELKGSVDTVITISNDKLLATVGDDTPFTEAFRIADDVLRQAVQGISDLINVPGVINLDFADVKTIMEGMGVALMGSATASGENRAVEAAQGAISSPLLEEANINGARGVLLNIVGGPDLTMSEINEAASLIHQACDPDAEIIFGAVTDEKMTGSVTVTVIATGFSTPSRELADDPKAPNVVEYFPREDRQSQQPTSRRPTGRTLGTEHQRVAMTSQPRQPSGAPQRPPSGTQAHPNNPARPGMSNERSERRPNPTQHFSDERDVRRPYGHEQVRNTREEMNRYTAESSEQRTTSRHEPTPLETNRSAEFDTPEETLRDVLMTPQSYGANNMGFENENDLDIPTYLRNMRKMKKAP